MSAAVSLPTGIQTRTPRQVVTIAGVPYPSFSVETQHGVKRPKGTATIQMPRPDASLADLRARWLNQPLEAMVGYDEDGGARRVFAGRITSLSRGFDRGGYRLEVRATGWAALLDWPSEEDIVFSPWTRLYDIARSLCAMRGLPMYGGELITYPDSTYEVLMGGVAQVDEGRVVIPKRTSPLQWLVNTLETFGYHAFDRPDGMFWWGRVLGQPTADPVQTFAQGWDVFQMDREDSLDGMVTWWDVEGASWTDADGVPVKLRSFPAEVPYSPYLDPPGYVRDALSSPALVTAELVDNARRVAEINTAAPYEEEAWRTPGTPGIQPGEVVALASSLLELADARRWVMTVDHTSSTRGIRTTWTGWQGAGTALPAGDDREEIVVFTGARHVGDEYLPQYEQPTPQGREIAFEVTIPETYTAIYLEGWVRGANSFLSGGPATDARVSTMEVWQGGDKAVGTATLPSVPESTNERQPFRLPVPGRLEPGVATVKILSGEDSAGGPDDLEIGDLRLVLTGVGAPVLPSGGS